MTSYSNYLNFACQNPWLNVASIALGLIGIILAIVFYFKSKKSKKPIYRIRNINLMKGNISKIKSVDILYQGNKIDNLSISKIVIWNVGKETINSTDIAKKDKFRIEIDREFKILEYELIFQKKTANDFKITKINDNVLEIDFDYFDYEEGIIVEIYHTATIKEALYVKGSLKGAKKIIRNESGKEIFTLFKKASNITDSILDYMFKKRILGLFLFLVPILLIMSTIFIFETNNKNAIFIITTNGISVVLYWFLWYVTIRTKLPKGFDLFESEF
jgi:hypothetical protein